MLPVRVGETYFETFDPMVRHNTDSRAWLVSIELEEDSKNSVTYAP